MQLLSIVMCTFNGMGASAHKIMRTVPARSLHAAGIRSASISKRAVTVTGDVAAHTKCSFVV